MYYDYFSIKEFLVDRVMTNVPIHVVDKIERHHKPIINRVRHKIGQPIHVSQNSGSVSYTHLTLPTKRIV